MNLKNYTTRIPAHQSIHAIKKILIDFGAIGIMEEYDSKKTISCINFILDVDGYKLPFRLPIKIEATYKWLKNKRKTRIEEDELLKQAERVCWKQMLEWVQIQLSLVMLDQAEPLEVFFPFLWDSKHKETYYQKIKAGNYKALLSN